MHNELVLLLNLLLVYGLVLFFWRLWGKYGLICWICIATILANIEVLILIDAYGLEQTLGNILFASTFIATDILSENASKDWAKKAVNLGIGAAVSLSAKHQRLGISPFPSNLYQYPPGAFKRFGSFRHCPAAGCLALS